MNLLARQRRASAPDGTGRAGFARVIFSCQMLPGRRSRSSPARRASTSAVGDRRDVPDVRRLRMECISDIAGAAPTRVGHWWLLEQYGFPYANLRDAEIRKGGLNDRYDIVNLPNDYDRRHHRRAERSGGHRRPVMAPEYRSGIGAEGFEALRRSSGKGERARDWGMHRNCAGGEVWAWPCANVTAGRNPREFWCPGSTLKVKVDAGHSLALGIPPTLWPFTSAATRLRDSALPGE